MANPIRVPWATDVNHPAGGDPWSAQPNKVEPSVGRLEEGWPPEILPPAEHMNYLISELAKWIDRAHSIPLTTLLEADFTSVTGWGVGASRDIVYSPAYDAFHAIDADGYTIYSADPWDTTPLVEGGHGVRWEDESASPKSALGWTAAGTRVRLCTDAAGTRLAISNSAITQVARSILLGAWAAVTPVTVGASWTACCHGGGLFAIGNSGGIIETSLTGSTYVLRASGLTLASLQINCLEHNQEAGADARFVALTQQEVSYSADGITWTAAAHGLSSTPLRLAYSAKGKRWVALLTNGDIAYSDDQGATWTQLASVLPLWNTTFPGGQGSGLASDGEGGFIALDGTATQQSIWASKDNGLTWYKIYPTLSVGYLEGGIAYGLGGFCAIGDTGALFSPRLLPY